LIYRIEARAGGISLSKNIIGRIVVESIGKFRDKALLSNHKGKVRKIEASSDAVGIMDINMGPQGLDLRVYVVIKFGASIGIVTNGLIEEIYTRTKELTGLEPNSVAVIVTGMVSKRQTARRNIEVKR